METVLKMSFSDMKSIVFCKRFLSGILLAACCLVLYYSAGSGMTGYEELSKANAVRLQTAGSHASACLAEPYDYVKHVAAGRLCGLPDIAYEGRNKVSAGLDLKANIPCDIFKEPVEREPEVMANDLAIMVSDPADNMEGTVAAVPESAEDLPGDKEIAGFVCDANGYIVSCTDKINVTDGLLVFPMSEECVGVRKGALDSLSDKITEIYIPKNICVIEPGAFDCLELLEFIEVADNHPCYYSNDEDGCLYTMSGEKLAGK